MKRPLAPREAARVEAALTSRDPFGETAPPCLIGTDGAQWVVEAIDAGGYRVTERWSPESGAVRELGLALLALTGWDPRPVY